MATTVPKHIAFIPDGNRRWASEQGLSAKEGHQRGVDIFQEIVRHAADKDIETISLWGMSIDNFFKRTPLEIKNLLDIFQAEFERLLTDEEIHEKKIRVRVLGRWQEKFPSKLCRTIEKVVDVTQNYTNHNLNFFLAYNGTDEMLRAISNIVESGASTITPELVKKHLFTRELPPVDFLVRTGGEPHLSAGFMMWDIADAELYFTETYWPAFNTKEFDKALDDFASRRRMKGK